MIDQILQHIIIMQYPVVASLVILGLQARFSFRSREFILIAGGWFANLLYLTSQNYPNILLNTILPLNLGTLNTPLTFLSTALFWLAARKYRDGDSWVLLRYFNTRIFILLSSLVLIWVMLFAKFNPEESYPEFLLTAVPDATFHTLGIYALALFFRRFARDQGSSNRLLYISTFAYAAIQPLHLLTGEVPLSVRSFINIAGFLSGLVAKSSISFGLLRFFADAAAKAGEQRATARETRRTVERITHELGTPIAEMLLHVETLTRESERRGRFHQSLLELRNALFRVEAIMGASRNLSVFGDLLTRKGSFASSMPAEQKTVSSVNRLVQTAVMAVKSTRDEDVKFEINYSGEVCIRGKDSEIIQIFINILRNAYDALPTGEGMIIIRTENLPGAAEEKTDKVQVTIIDDGHGLDTTLLQKIFEDGFSTRGAARGHGLAIAKELIERNYGRIEIKNRSHPTKDVRGCVVIVQFPRTPCDERRK